MPLVCKSPPSCGEVSVTIFKAVKDAPEPLKAVAVTNPVLGLYVKSPSDSSPTLPVAEASSIKGIKLFSFVDSLSATET